MARILLIDPPSPKNINILRTWGNIGTSKADVKWPPYDLMLLGGLFRKNDIHDFKIIDANNLGLTYQELEKILVKENPEYIIFLISRNGLNYDLQLPKMAKKIRTNIKTVAIGLSIRAIKNLEGVLETNSELDVIVYSWAEMPVLNLVKGVPETDVKGIYWKKDGKVIKNDPQEPIFSNFGVPAHDKIPLEIYKDPLAKRRPMSGLRFSIGCIGACDFCPTVPFQRPVLFREIEEVIDELSLLQSLGVKEIRFFDCTFSNSMEYAKTLLNRMLEEKFDFTWMCEERADSVNPELLNLMKRAGCHLIMLGADSSSQQILDTIGKGETVEQIEQAAKWIKDTGIKLHMYATLGHPGETKETLKDTIKWIKMIGPDTASFGITTPVPGTKFYDYLTEKGYMKKDIDPVNFDPMMEPVYDYPNLTSKEMLEISKKGYREFYLRPKFILKRLGRVSSWKNEISNAMMFYRAYVKKHQK